MAKAHNCTKPDEGWALYGHFLGGQLLAISGNCQATEEEGKDQREKRERVVEEARAKLIGYLYLIQQRMILHGYRSDANRMGRILDFVVDEDLEDPEARNLLHALHEELNPQAGKFEEALTQLKAGKIPKE